VVVIQFIKPITFSSEGETTVRVSWDQFYWFMKW